MSKGQLLSSEQGWESKVQHKTPCSDCPMARTALPGWLGGSTPEEYVKLAHSQERVGCHVITNQQCAGMAIYRKNVVKRADFVLPADKVKVFASPLEFARHHDNWPRKK